MNLFDIKKEDGNLTQKKDSELNNSTFHSLMKVGNNNGKYIPPHLRNKNSKEIDLNDNKKEENHWNVKNDFKRNFKKKESFFNNKKNYNNEYLEEVNPFMNSSKEELEIDFNKYDEIPIDIKGRDCPKPIENWGNVELHFKLLNNIKLANYKRPTPIQKYSLPIVIQGRDLMGCAQTGSGKTAAFLFPIISHLLNNVPPQNYYNHFYDRKRVITPYALILAPTRELACQIYDESKKFSYKTGLRSVVVYGGAPISDQLYELQKGCDLLVATPGRLVDILERKRVSLSKIHYLVLDEADRMLDMGFEPQIRKIVEEEDMPPKDQRQTLMFSATFPKEIQNLAKSFLNDYIFLAVGRVGSTTNLVTQKFFRVEENEKPAMLLDLLNSIEGLTIIFVETRKNADILENYLIKKGFPATCIHGDRKQEERTYALRSFSSGETPYLIATNVAARGLDIDNIAHVINYDMPTDIDDYVHRIGRTGRAGKAGLATAFISEENVNIIPKLLEILKESDQDIPKWLESMKNLSKNNNYNNNYFGGNKRGNRIISKFDYNNRYDNTKKSNYLNQQQDGNNSSINESWW
jgi:ATP-dependent RNA helicase DDX3X